MGGTKDNLRCVNANYNYAWTNLMRYISSSILGMLNVNNLCCIIRSSSSGILMNLFY